jgi:hypothetical protein
MSRNGIPYAHQHPFSLRGPQFCLVRPRLRFLRTRFSSSRAGFRLPLCSYCRFSFRLLFVASLRARGVPALRSLSFFGGRDSYLPQSLSQPARSPAGSLPIRLLKAYLLLQHLLLDCGCRHLFSQILATPSHPGWCGDAEHSAAEPHPLPPPRARGDDLANFGQNRLSRFISACSSAPGGV